MTANKKIFSLAEFDAEYAGGRSYVLGIDEAGRGALAGPVCAAAALVGVPLYKNRKFLELLAELNDSKQISEHMRESIFSRLEDLKAAGAIDFEAAFASEGEIERLNILGATQLAMSRAASSLNQRHSLGLRPAGGVAPLFGEPSADSSKAVVLIDGKPMKKFPYAHLAVVKGDASSFAVAAASVVAKVSRDRLMSKLAADYPRYGFEIHKGYGTPAHLQALMLYGASKIHRAGFLKKIRAKPLASPEQTELW